MAESSFDKGIKEEQMAERVLPSREEIIHIRTGASRHNASILIAQLMTAYASGRLVDREAIDYEAMARELLAAGAFRDRNILSAAAYEPLMRTMVLAALGEETP